MQLDLRVHQLSCFVIYLVKFGKYNNKCVFMPKLSSWGDHRSGPAACSRVLHWPEIYTLYTIKIDTYLNLTVLSGRRIQILTPGYVIFFVRIVTFMVRFTFKKFVFENKFNIV